MAKNTWRVQRRVTVSGTWSGSTSWKDAFFGLNPGDRYSISNWQEGSAYNHGKGEANYPVPAILTPVTQPYYLSAVYWWTYVDGK